MTPKRLNRRQFLVMACGAIGTCVTVAACGDRTAETTGATSTAAGTRCPYHLVNDPYPGRCRRYRDQIGDGLCDLSQAA